MSLEDNNRVALWEAAQAQSKALSDRTTATFNQVYANRPNGEWSNNAPVTPNNGSPIYSGSIGPGTFQSNGSPP